MSYRSSRGQNIINLALKVSKAENEMESSSNDQDNEYDGYDSDVDPEFRLADEFQTNIRHIEEQYQEGDDVALKIKEEMLEQVIHSTPVNTGKTVEKKEFKDFNCSCKMNCYVKVTTNDREEQFNRYWELGDYNAQTAFIGALVHEGNKNRSYGETNSNRTYSRKYMLNKIQVCRNLFINTLGISIKRVNTAMKKLRSSTLTDKRGQKQGGKNKISQERKQEIINQIDRIPKYVSHYRRLQCGDAQFLPPEMTLKLMYNKYKEDTNNPVSFVVYRCIFMAEFNLKFKSLKKDTCTTCDSYQAKIDSTQDNEVKVMLVNKHDTHIKHWPEARAKMKQDLDTATR
ncbi:unnamed protein product [Diabrotica balteata]|uniref:Uncharacterized protein n=1 Tax=Diabrotica balteata TaxID=107213 RepID=A0A9N9TAS0_DIABA|nr:unnamed protein product [Diabrotica balteata]